MNRHELGEPHLHCSVCDATPALGAGGNCVDAPFGYLFGSDCPACDAGQLIGCDELGEYEPEDVECLAI